MRDLQLPTSQPFWNPCIYTVRTDQLFYLQSSYPSCMVYYGANSCKTTSFFVTSSSSLILKQGKEEETTRKLPPCLFNTISLWTTISHATRVTTLWQICFYSVAMQENIMSFWVFFLVFMSRQHDTIQTIQGQKTNDRFPVKLVTMVYILILVSQSPNFIVH